MVKPPVNLARAIAVVLVQICGAIFSLMGLGCSIIGTVLRYRFPQSHLYLFCQLLVCLAAVLVGLATVFRYRMAAVVVASSCLLLCVDAAHGMARYSRFEIIAELLIALIPAIVTVFAWPRLRS
jgi:hypothetical protein